MLRRIWKRLYEADLREVSNVCKQVQASADAQAKGACNLQSANWILDVVKNVIDVRPPSVCIDDFEHGGGILGHLSVSRYGYRGRKDILVHHHCCENFQRRHHESLHEVP